MSAPRPSTKRRSGFSLIETVIALCVLAVTVPLVFLALETGGRSGMTSATESRSRWMVEACLEEIRASREGRARWLSNTRPGSVIPPDGELWALAFSNDGRVLGKVAAGQWAAGIGHLDGQAVRYLAGIESIESVSNGIPAMRVVRISLEDPAAAPAGKRGKSGFHTLVP